MALPRKQAQPLLGLDVGNAAQNADIAKQRAEAVRNKLVALGAPADGVELQKPADIQAGAGPMARRVEVTLR